MDSELLKKLQNRRSVVDVEGTHYGQVSPDKKKEVQAANDEATEDQAEKPARLTGTRLSGALNSSQRAGSFSDAGVSDRQSFASPSAPKAAIGGAAGSELQARLQKRRSLVDEEWSGTTADKPSDSEHMTGDPVSQAKVSGLRNNLETSNCSGRLLGERPERSNSSSRIGAKKEARAATGDTMDNELLRMLHSRRHTVENEGASWQSLPIASFADAHRARRVQRPNTRNSAVSARHSATMADGPATPEYGPWELLWRGARTWVVEVRIDRRILTTRSATSCAAAGLFEPYVFATHVGVLCLGDGALSICEAVAPPPGVQEDADYAQLLCSARLSDLQCIEASPATPCVLRFCITCSEADGPAFVALFESSGEAAACAAAVARRAAAEGLSVSFTDGPPPDLEGFSAALSSTTRTAELVAGSEEPSDG